MSRSAWLKESWVAKNSSLRQSPFLLWIEASAVLMLIGAFGPWVKAFAFTVSGTDGSNDGWIVVVAALFGGVLAAITYKNRGAGLCALIGGVAGLSGFPRKERSQRPLSEMPTAREWRVPHGHLGRDRSARTLKDEPGCEKAPGVRLAARPLRDHLKVEERTIRSFIVPESNFDGSSEL